MMPGVRVGLHIVIGQGVQSDRHAEGSSGETDRKGREFMDAFTLDWPLDVVGYPPVVLEGSPTMADRSGGVSVFVRVRGKIKTG